MTKREFNYDVFISFSSHDSGWAKAVYEHLNRHRVRCFNFAETAVPAGDLWKEKLAENIATSRILLLIASKHTAQSDTVLSEVSLAKRKGVVLVPVRIDRGELQGALELDLERVHRVDALGPPTEENLAHVTDSVLHHLGKAPAFPNRSKSRGPRTRLVAMASVVLGAGLGAGYYATRETVSASAAPEVWINEFHYDNEREDAHEFVELAGPAGLDLKGWELLFYHGKSGELYDSLPLFRVFPDERDGFGTLAFDRDQIRNGWQGIALARGDGTVVEFLSYGDEILASDGPARGMTSELLDVYEGSRTPAEFSIQRVGRGTWKDFRWIEPRRASPGQLNQSQEIEIPH